MMEVVFSDSAAGSLMQAAHFGKGAFRGGGIGFIYAEGDSSDGADMERLRREAVERRRREWESAVPLDVKRADIFCLGLALSIGEISGPDFWSGRGEAFEKLRSVWPAEGSARRVEEKLAECRERLALLLERCASGEEMRIWYSDNPDEMSGFYHLMSLLCPIEGRGRVCAVKLPDWETMGDGTARHLMGCGELGPGDWGRLAMTQREITPAYMSWCAAKWRELQEENSALRAVINGQLCSAAEDVYDGFIRREIAAAGEEFMESRLIGAVLGKYMLGIGDAWLHFRVEEMIKRGELAAVTLAPDDGPVYRRKLKKV